MLRALRDYSALAVLAGGVLGGCSWFSHDRESSQAPAAAIRDTRNVDIEISTSPNVNPDALGRSQPVKVCVIETSKPGWTPESISEGAPCRDGALEDGVLSRNQRILQPNQTWSYHLDIPAHQARWIVVGAEFQQISGALYLIEQKSSAQTDSDIRVRVGMTALSVVANDKKMDK